MYSYIHSQQVAANGIGALFLLVAVLTLIHICIRIFDWWKSRK